VNPQYDNTIAAYVESWIDGQRELWERHAVACGYGDAEPPPAMHREFVPLGTRRRWTTGRMHVVADGRLGRVSV